MYWARARGLHVEQLFYRFAIAQAVRDRRHVVHAVHVGIEHGVGTVLGDLLHAAMQIANHAFGAQNLFAVELQDDAQHAVSGGVLRAHVDDEFVGIEKGFLVLFQFEVGSPVDRCLVEGCPVGHCPLSIPRLICTHSWSCWMMP